ncbi:MAG TPA: hypothetical protein VGJ32_09990, partial [Solirubrobacteraceae bacterium]
MAACPRCGLQEPLALAGGAVCARCRSDDAWERYATRGPLVIARAEVHALAARRDERGRGRPWGHALLAIASAAGGVAAAILTWRLFRAQPPRALESIVGRLETVSWHAIAGGIVALLLGSAGLFALWRRRRVRSHAILSGHLAGLVAGALAVVAGGLHLRSVDVGLAHLAMPPLGAITPDVLTPHFARVARATVVIVAGDADGDAR